MRHPNHVRGAWLAIALLVGAPACAKATPGSSSSEAESTGTNADGTPAGGNIGRLSTTPHGSGPVGSETTGVPGSSTTTSTPVSSTTSSSPTPTTPGVTLTLAPTTLPPTTAPTTAPPTTAAHLDPETTAMLLYDAWQAGDVTGAHLYATDAVVTSLFGHGLSTLTFDHCEGAAGSTYCTWAKPGLTLVMRVNNATGGGTVQVVEAVFS